MLPFRQRVCIVLWAVWLAVSVTVAVSIVASYMKANPEAYPQQSPSTLNSAFVVPVKVVEAYKLGLMTSREGEDFESDLRAGQIMLPAGMSVTLPPRYPNAAETVVPLAVFSVVSAFGLALFQFLIVGFANPVRLFRPGRI